jgi:hypothetical protein
MQTEFSKGMSLSAPGGFLRALTAILRDLCVLGFMIADAHPTECAEIGQPSLISMLESPYCMNKVADESPCYFFFGGKNFFSIDATTT